jgi:hypothetical protein
MTDAADLKLSYQADSGAGRPVTFLISIKPKLTKRGDMK